MTAIIMDGRKVAKDVQRQLKERIMPLERKPGLGVILVGSNAASAVYVRNKEKACADVGIVSVRVNLPQQATEQHVLEAIDLMNDDPSVDGILLQLPLPPNLDEKKIMARISAQKEVDGFHLENLGKLVAGIRGIRACTPKGIMRLLDEYKIDPAGKHVVVVGRSTIVGKPVALMLLERNATVTICHSRTPSLVEYLKTADIVVVAVGKAKVVTADMVKHDAVVIDVGMNRLDEGLVGDVDFAPVSQKASYITPVPGGVGPMTIAMLLENTLELYEAHEQL